MTNKTAQPNSPMFLVGNWDALYENNRTRALKAMAWVPVPNSHDGDGYSQLTAHQNAASHLGCWLAILQVASKCSPRGTLSRDTGEPHTPESLARMTRLPEVAFSEAIPRLIDIGWLVVDDNGGDDDDGMYFIGRAGRRLVRFPGVGEFGPAV
jgi:hypothetical protein